MIMLLHFKIKQVHWLPISLRIIYKIGLITYKSLNGLTSHYTKNMLKPFTQLVNKSTLLIQRIPYRTLSTTGELW